MEIKGWYLISWSVGGKGGGGQLGGQEEREGGIVGSRGMKVVGGKQRERKGRQGECWIVHNRREGH